MLHFKMFPISRIALATFLVENLDPLRHAAALLGGPGAPRRVSALVQGVTEPLPLSRRLGRELRWLEELLTLEHVHELDRPEAAQFSAIDPGDPVVAELCLLTDEYMDRLMALREEETSAFDAQLQAA